jgi:hypothetical protein
MLDELWVVFSTTVCYKIRSRADNMCRSFPSFADNPLKRISQSDILLWIEQKWRLALLALLETNLSCCVQLHVCCIMMVITVMWWRMGVLWSITSKWWAMEMKIPSNGNLRLRPDLYLITTVMLHNTAGQYKKFCNSCDISLCHLIHILPSTAIIL